MKILPRTAAFLPYGCGAAFAGIPAGGRKSDPAEWVDSFGVSRPLAFSILAASQKPLTTSFLNTLSLTNLLQSSSFQPAISCRLLGRTRPGLAAAEAVVVAAGVAGAPLVGAPSALFTLSSGSHAVAVSETAASRAAQARPVRRWIGLLRLSVGMVLRFPVGRWFAGPRRGRSRWNGWSGRSGHFLEM